MAEVSPETLIAVGVKKDRGYVGIRPPLPESARRTMEWVGVLRPGSTETVSHPDGDYTLVDAEGDVIWAQHLAGRIAFAAGVDSDSTFAPIYEPVSILEEGSSPFEGRES